MVERSHDSDIQNVAKGKDQNENSENSGKEPEQVYSKEGDNAKVDEEEGPFAQIKVNLDKTVTKNKKSEEVTQISAKKDVNSEQQPVIDMIAKDVPSNNVAPQSIQKKASHVSITGNEARDEGSWRDKGADAPGDKAPNAVKENMPYRHNEDIAPIQQTIVKSTHASETVSGVAPLGPLRKDSLGRIPHQNSDLHDTRKIAGPSANIHQNTTHSSHQLPPQQAAMASHASNNRQSQYGHESSSGMQAAGPFTISTSIPLQPTERRAIGQIVNGHFSSSNNGSIQKAQAPSIGGSKPQNSMKPQQAYQNSGFSAASSSTMNASAESLPKAPSISDFYSRFKRKGEDRRVADEVLMRARKAKKIGGGNGRVGGPYLSGNMVSNATHGSINSNSQSNGSKVMPMKRWGIYGSNGSVADSNASYGHGGGHKENVPSFGIVGISNNGGNGKESHAIHASSTTGKLPSLHFAPNMNQGHTSNNSNGMVVVNSSQVQPQMNLPSLYNNNNHHNYNNIASNAERSRARAGQVEKV
ncbi:hypothetical protein HDU97_002515 [Phlyctochytrium planicorne]|nr:hypothetical protein HDU97_002515 [Phlyctochytrium planicorne]